GAQDLSAALAGLAPPVRADVVSGPGDDAAVLRAGAGFQVITTDHLRAFTDDAGLMARIAAIHAMGDVWAMGATPQAALAQITLPRMSPRMHSETLREIMAAAAEVFAAAGADVVGGHTSVGTELTIGFTVTGLTGHITAKGGAVSGDALILTKPLGTGTILAAEMAHAHPDELMLGEAFAAALAQMTAANGIAAAILAPHAHAMTDVTGFGLAGHLLEILTASNCAATLTLGAIPLLPGAQSLAAAGIASSLAPANRAACTAQMTFTESPRAALLFDPQTAGGLLAAVSKTQATALIAALRGQGVGAAMIGTLAAGPAHLTVTP
ncbi:MAG: selenide, water dikinase SelD, partial [Paracoccaceae bacterium]|nr:selenide, water dikinase SelD [Paracoccaceae bacterium]